MPNRAHGLSYAVCYFSFQEPKKKDYSVSSWHFVSSTEQLVLKSPEIWLWIVTLPKCVGSYTDKDFLKY